MEIPASIHNRFGAAHSSGDGLAFQAGLINNSTVNINQRPRNIHWPKAVDEATFDAANKEHVPSCLPGTRIEVLKEIRQWIEGDSPKRLYWLNGMAGTGKSTIALTLARTYARAENVSLGASFFFSRGSGDLASASRFAVTIARQLAETSPEMQRLIENAVETNPRLETLSVREQWEKLVIRPLSKLHQNTFRKPAPLLLIVDALDECNNAEDVYLLIKCLELATHIENASCRAFLTSRPDQSIKVGMSYSLFSSRETFILHNIERSIVDQDIRLYYRHQLADIKTKMSLTLTWSDSDLLSDRTINHLVERSHGLFIHAVTICRFVRNGGYLSIQRLENLMRSEKSANAEQELDKIYTTVLEYSLASVTNHLEEREIDKIHQLFQLIVGSIVATFDVMSSENLALLLGETIERVRLTLSSFHSVIDVPDDSQKPIRILHPSFRDFLLDPQRCTVSLYATTAGKPHSVLATRCLDILISQLQRNPLHLKRPGTKTRDAPTGLVEKNIPIPLQYASRYWMDHILHSGTFFQSDSKLLDFLQNKFLFWIEGLAWIGKLEKAIETMSRLNKFLASSQKRYSSDFVFYNGDRLKLDLFVQNALRFVMSHVSIIDEAPLQVYLSSLFFTPSSGSKVRWQKHHKIPEWISNEPQKPKKLPSHDPSLSLKLSLPHVSLILHFVASPDSLLIATVCADSLIHIWDARTGRERLTIKGNQSKFAGLAFSPDSENIALLTSMTVSFWKISNPPGEMILPTFQIPFLNPSGSNNPLSNTANTFENWTPCIAFSPDGSLLAGSYFSRDIWVWNTRFTRSVKFHFQARRWVEKLFFSLDGSLLISVSEFKFHTPAHELVNVWDLTTGLSLGSEVNIPARGPLAFIHGTRYIGVLSGHFEEPLAESRLVIRDARTGSEYESFVLDSLYFPKRAVLRAQDGLPLLASNNWKKVYVWAPDEDKALRAVGAWDTGGIGSIRDMILSPDGKFVAVIPKSGNVVHIWNVDEALRKPSSWRKLWQRRIVLLGIILLPLLPVLIVQTKILSAFERPSVIIDSEERDKPDESQFFIQSPDGNLLATRFHTTSAIIFDIKSGKKRAQVDTIRGLAFLKFSPNGKICATWTGKGIQLWDMVKGKKTDLLVKNGLKGVLYDGHFVFSHRSNKIVQVEYSTRAPGQLGEYRVWQINGPRRVSDFKISFPSSLGKTIRLSPDDRLYGSWKKGGDEVEIRCLSDNRLLFRRAIDRVEELQFAPDSQCVLVLTTCPDDEGRREIGHIWNTTQDTFDELVSSYDTSITRTAFSEDGSMLAIVAGTTIDFYEVSTSTALHRMKLDFQPRIIRFASSGTHVITERGSIILPGSSPPSTPQLFATRTWIQENGEDIVAIPAAFQNSVVGVNGHTVAFYDREHGPLFLRLDEGVKAIA